MAAVRATRPASRDGHHLSLDSLGSLPELEDPLRDGWTFHRTLEQPALLFGGGGVELGEFGRHSRFEHGQALDHSVLVVAVNWQMFARFGIHSSRLGLCKFIARRVSRLSGSSTKGEELWVHGNAVVLQHQSAELNPVFMGRDFVRAVQALPTSPQLLFKRGVHVHAEQRAEPAHVRTVQGVHPNRRALGVDLDGF